MPLGIIKRSELRQFKEERAARERLSNGLRLIRCLGFGGGGRKPACPCASR
jgi:hypothetical protein